MPLFQLDNSIRFPNPALAEPDGLLAIGGDLTPERLLLAYHSGIFPWYGEGEPILWWSPDPRFVLSPADLHVPKSMRPVLGDPPFTLSMDRAFPEVVEACKATPRPGQSGTWITAEMQNAYIELNKLGWAHSIEVWGDDGLVGGIYGVAVGNVFCGESMFSKVSNASKYGFIRLVRWLQKKEFQLIDCQVYTDHLARFGAVEVSRSKFLSRLAEATGRSGFTGSWSNFEDELTIV